MFVVVITKSAWHAVGEQIGSLLTFVNKTYSETGQVKLASRDPREEPIVEFNLLSDKRDLDRLMSGFRKMAGLQMSAPLKAVTDKPFPAAYSDRVRKIGVVNTKNKILTAIAAKLMDGPAALRHYMIDNFVVEGFTFEQVMSDDEALEAFVRKAAIGVWHASCSCRMGRRGRSDGGRRYARPRQGRAGLARGRRLDLSGGAVRQHQFPGADDGGEDRRRDAVRTAGLPAGLRAMPQQVVGEDAGHHRLAHRHGADADAGVVAALGQDLDILPKRSPSCAASGSRRSA